MRGICIDSGGSVNIKIKEVYYLFPHGGFAFDVSNFSDSGLHLGTYQRSRFKIITVDEKVEKIYPSEPMKNKEMPVLEEGKVYEAELVWKKEGYRTPLGKYFIRATYGCYANKNDCFFYTDAELKEARGRFPIHWFANIREYDLERVKKNTGRKVGAVGII